MLSHGIAVERVRSEGRAYLAASGRRGNDDGPLRVTSSRAPAVNGCRNGAASETVVAALEALGAVQRPMGRKPGGGNGLDELLPDRALQSRRRSRTSLYLFEPQQQRWIDVVPERGAVVLAWPVTCCHP